MTKIHIIKILLFFNLLLIVLSAQVVLAQKTVFSKTEKKESVSQELNAIKERLETIEKNKLSDNALIEHTKQALSISSNTVK